MTIQHDEVIEEWANHLRRSMVHRLHKCMHGFDPYDDADRDRIAEALASIMLANMMDLARSLELPGLMPAIKQDPQINTGHWATDETQKG